VGTNKLDNVRDFQILDVTLRDGSYANNFQFSCAQQKLITGEIEKAGIEYIEIGHGMGIGANSPKNGLALHTDKEYLAAAHSSLKKAKYGTFCIPGIAKLEDIDLLAEHGASFVRIGTNADAVDTSEDYIKRAKSNGLMVMTNFMKSYAISPKEFAENAIKSQDFGADMIYVVDSAGSMMPEQIEEIYGEIRKVSNIALGFHGHDNLGMAMINSFKALELGFEYIDTSLQGMGRSSGNTSTELFAITAQKRGYKTGIDSQMLIEASCKYVYPMYSKHNSIDVMCGVTGFHTSYLGAIHRVAGLYGVNPLLLMAEYTKIDQLSMDENILRKIAEKLPEDIEGLALADFIGYFGNEQCK